MNEVISLDNVSKKFRTGLFKQKMAVSKLSFGVPKGEILGLLGPNGSGKSTTIKMIMGFLKPTEGEIVVCGKPADDNAARREIGYLPENPRFPKFLTGRELMSFYAGLYGMTGNERGKRIEELLELVNLTKACDERIQGYSKGMTQRLAIAQSMLSKPSILIFDEPMSGLDPLGRLEIRKLITQIHNEMPEATLFFSTHILSDVEALCSSVLLLRGGKLTRQCHVSELVTDEHQRFEIQLADLTPQLKSNLIGKSSSRLTPGGMTLWMEGNTDMLIEKLVELRKQGAKVVALSSQRKTLEEALFGGEVMNPERNYDLNESQGAVK